jgi:eukaryotic-like serine/threonine-protein kinase
VNSTVTITLNEGPKTAVIPDGLVGKDVDDVEKTLEDELNFTNVKTVAAKSEDPSDKPNEVLRIRPAEGTTVPLDEEITVTYATGESEVPNFVGVTAARARELADQAGFPDPSFTEEESDQPAGTVIDQNPNAGKRVDRDTRIRLTLAKAPEPEPEPPDPEPTQTPTPTPTETVPTPTVTPT